MNALKKTKLAVALMLAVVITVAVAETKWMGKSKIDMGQFVKELLIIDVKEKSIVSAMWVPFEFHVRTAAINDSKQDVEFFKSYLIFIVQSSTENLDGSQKYMAEKQLKNCAVISSKTTKDIKPIAEIPNKLAKRIEAFKSIMATDAKSKANMCVLVFPSKTPTGEKIVNAKTRDKLILKLNGSKFVWRTPFEALIEGGICDQCHEQVKAKWHYCPWCGAKL